MTRGKIVLKPVEDEGARQVSFSKRRQSMFKKASELSVMCGSTVGSVAFSRSGRSYSFGHPSIDHVANRFLNSVPDGPPASSAASHGNSLAVTGTVQNLNIEYLELQQSVDSEKEKIGKLQEATNKEMGGPMMQWLNSNMLELGLDELLEYQKWLEAVDGVVKEKGKNKTVVEASQSATQPPMEMVSASQYQFGEHISANSMAFTDLANSSNGFIDGIEVNDPLLGGGDLYDVCGLGNFPNNQNHG